MKDDSEGGGVILERVASFSGIFVEEDDGEEGEGIVDVDN